MAEALGVAASGIAVAQLATQVASSLVKLKTFWNLVRDVPDDVSFMLREIESLNVILSQIKSDITSPSNPFSASANAYITQSLALCQEGSDELNTLAGDLAATIDKKHGLKKALGSVKIVLKNDETKKLKKRMKSAIRLLTLSHQCYMSATIQLQPNIITAQIASHLSSIAISPPASDESIPDLQDPTRTLEENRVVPWSIHPVVMSWTEYFFGTMKYGKKTHRYRGTIRRGFFIRYMSPSWMARFGWDLRAYNTISRLDANLHFSRSVEGDSPFFQAVESGDMANVRKMLISGEGSVTDRLASDFSIRGPLGREEPGSTALHLAVKNGDFEMCQLLISEGADVLAFTDSDKCPLHRLVSVSAYLAFTKNIDVLPLVRLLLRNGSADLLIDNNNILANTRGPLSLFQCIQQEMFPPYNEWPLSKRLDTLIVNAGDKWENTPLLLQTFLFDPSEVPSEVLNWTHKMGGWSLLHILARAFAVVVSMSRSAPRYLDDSFSSIIAERLWKGEHWSFLWVDIIRDLISAGAPLHAKDTAMQTPFMYLFQGLLYYKPSGAKLTQALRTWLHILIACGIDLLAYGAEEDRTWRHLKENNSFLYRTEYETCSVDEMPFFGFSYGPNIDDWKFWFFERTDRYAGDFWRMIEREQGPTQARSKTGMPGAWADDDDDDWDNAEVEDDNG